MKNSIDPIENKIKKGERISVSEFFSDPKNIEIIEENKKHSEKISKYIRDWQEKLIKELNMDLIKNGLL